jgi:hypothetical protein
VRVNRRDRAVEVELEGTSFERLAGFASLAYVQRAFAQVPAHGRAA